VFPIQVPALRHREGDIPLLAGFFAERFRRKLGLQQLTLSSSVMALLEAYQWPGNVRDLEHVLSRAALFAKAETPTGITVISSSHLTGLQINKETQKRIQNKESNLIKNLNDGRRKIDFRLETEAYQRNLIQSALDQTNGNWTKAAEDLSMDRANLARLAKRLGIRVIKEIVLKQ
jgi:anaerobic nitric oxide reductase transcription regulator